MAFGENMPERLDRLIGVGRMPPVAVAFPDCFTRIGGNQYVNSAVTTEFVDSGSRTVSFFGLDSGSWEWTNRSSVRP